MLGWNIGIYRQNDANDGSPSLTTGNPVARERLAIWQTGPDGLDWIHNLVTAGKAIDLGGNGYPNQYIALSESIIPRIVDVPPGARTFWSREPFDFVTDKWEGKTIIDAAVIARCGTDEWLLVEAWDES